MVSEGWAIAYRKFSMDYVDEENDAHAKRKGAWRGQFVPAWEWRRGVRLPSESKLSNQAPDSSACKIKGNISKNGQRIYHLPGQENYDETVISPERGERFFCSWLTLAVTSSAAIKSARYRAHLPG